MNRITDGIARTKAQIEDRIAKNIVTAEQVEKTRQGLDMDSEEYALFQELKSHAVSMGTLTAEEGQSVYRLLGNTPEVFNRQAVEVKWVLTGLFRQLLERRLAA